MADQLPSMYPESREAHSPPGRGKHGYYRKPNGWIVVAATTPTNRSDYEYKGFTFLPQYGEFTNGTNVLGAKQLEQDDRGTPWNPAVEPWRLILQRGGAEEFPVEQVIAYRWHLRPPYREAEFPQLKDVGITNYFCPECEKGVFASTVAREAAEQLRTHLTTGMNNRHSYTPTDLRALGEELDIDFDSARVGRLQELKTQSMEPSPAPPEMTPTARLTCEEEGCEFITPEDSKNHPASLRMHGMSHKKEPALA